MHSACLKLRVYREGWRWEWHQPRLPGLVPLPQLKLCRGVLGCCYKPSLGTSTSRNTHISGASLCWRQLNLTSSSHYRRRLPVISLGEYLSPDSQRCGGAEHQLATSALNADFQFVMETDRPWCSTWLNLSQWLGKYVLIYLVYLGFYALAISMVTSEEGVLINQNKLKLIKNIKRVTQRLQHFSWKHTIGGFSHITFIVY